MSDIDPVVVDSLKTLDPERPIREADIRMQAAAPATRRTEDVRIYLAAGCRMARRGFATPASARFFMLV